MTTITNDTFERLADTTYGSESWHPTGDGKVIRAKIAPDECFDLGDIGDYYGLLAWSSERLRHGDYRHSRPEGFDGGAEIIETDGCKALWWQVPPDIRRCTDAYALTRRALRDLLEYGYSVLIVEVGEGTDVYGRPVVMDADSVGGLEPGTDLAGWLADLLAGLGIEVEG